MITSDLSAADLAAAIKEVSGNEVTRRTVRKARQGRKPALSRLNNATNGITAEDIQKSDVAKKVYRRREAEAERQKKRK